MSRRVFGWWFLAEDVCSRLRTPPIDVGASDRQFERLLRESSLWSFAERGGAVVQAAWMESRLRSWMRAIAREWSPEPAIRLRAAGWVMTVSAVTALVAQGVRPSGMDPLGWALPAAVACSGVLVSFVAGRIARTARSRER